MSSKIFILFFSRLRLFKNSLRCFCSCWAIQPPKVTEILEKSRFHNVVGLILILKFSAILKCKEQLCYWEWYHFIKTPDSHSLAGKKKIPIVCLSSWCLVIWTSFQISSCKTIDNCFEHISLYFFSFCFQRRNFLFLLQFYYFNFGFKIFIFV